MNKYGRNELIIGLLSAGVAGFVALVFVPLAPLHHFLENEAWTRLTEFIAITLIVWLVLSLLVSRWTKIALGPGGLAAERLADAGFDGVEALRDIREANVRLGEKVARLEGIVETLALRPNGVLPSAPSSSDGDGGDGHQGSESLQADESEPQT